MNHLDSGWVASNRSMNSMHPIWRQTFADLRMPSSRSSPCSLLLLGGRCWFHGHFCLRA